MTLPVPNCMRNAPTGLMKELGYGEGYKYQPQFAYGHSLSGDQPVFDAKILFRHPVTNEYLPSEVCGETILREVGDLTGKKWDDDALKQWEEIENGGQIWAGRPSPAPNCEVINSSTLDA